MKNVLFVYAMESSTGLSNKAKKIENGFKDAGYSVNALYYVSDKGAIQRFVMLLMIFVKSSLSLFLNKANIVYLRHAYYFAPIYMISLLLRKKIQVEINSKNKSEFILKGQHLRSKIDELAFELALRASKSVHVVSMELTEKFSKEYHRSNFVFTPNFVVDEYYNSSAKKDNRDDVARLIFLGNTSQKWHGIDQFLEKCIIDNEWFVNNCELHFAGNCSTDIIELIEKHKLDKYVFVHGYVAGSEKYALLDSMDIGLSSFCLKRKGLSETTAIKIGDYLYSGLSVMIGYNDKTIPEDAEFCLRLDLDSQNSDQLKQSVNDFCRRVKKHSDLRDKAHAFAERDLLVNNYIKKIVSIK